MLTSLHLLFNILLKKKRPLWEDASYSPQVVINRLYNKHNHRNISCADYTIIDLQGNDMTTEIDDLIAKLEHARSRLNTILEKVTPQVDIYPSWKLKQLMDHITGWDELTAFAFRAHSRGETPALVVKHGIDQYNAESVGARKELSLEHSRQAYDAARAEVLQALREVPSEKLTQKFRAPWGGMCTVASVLKIFISHELEHAKQIEEGLKNSPESS
jgi:hemoglobin-like flavoprotein